MTEIDLIIGGRSFLIACEEDEQEKVKEAAEIINTEAEEIQAQLGRLPAVSYTHLTLPTIYSV